MLCEAVKAGGETCPVPCVHIAIAIYLLMSVYSFAETQNIHRKYHSSGSGRNDVLPAGGYRRVRPLLDPQTCLHQTHLLLAAKVRLRCCYTRRCFTVFRLKTTLDVTASLSAVLRS